MKKISLLIIISISALTTYSQDSIKKAKVYHNEFGIDATGFFKQFIYINSSMYGGDNYSPSYYLTYRRHFKNGNIRVAIGGAYTSYDLPPSSYDSNTYQFRDRSLALKIGYEFFSNLSKRWQVFYGADFRPSWAYSKDDAPYWNGGYANGKEAQSVIYGIAPLLGFSFKFNSRLSISTETSFGINYYQSQGRNYFIPESSAYTPLPDQKIPKSSKTYTSFSQPIAVIVTFDI